MSQPFHPSDLKWSDTRCKNHPKRKAVAWINPPIGSFFCKKCYRDLQGAAMRSKLWS